MAPNGHSDDAARGEHVFSPLHRLQAHLSRDRRSSSAQTQPHPVESPLDRDLSVRRGSEGFDNESVYSFDSVSTSGRLLDRLDLDLDDYAESEGSLRRRESAALMHSAGRFCDLPSDELNPGLSVDLRQIPIRANSALGLDRVRSLKRQPPARTLSQNNRLPVQSGPGNLVQPRKNSSYDSLLVDIASRQNSVSSLTDIAPPNVQNMLSKLGTLRSQQKLPTYSPILESTSEFSSPGRAASAAFPPITHSRSTESQPLVSLSGERKISLSSVDSNSSRESSDPIFNATYKFDPSIDASTRNALVISAQGNHREASYQLHTLANSPYNYPKAMYLYAKALKIGQGVKINEAHCIKWLCRCILTSYIAETSDPSSSTFTSYVSKLANLLPETLLDIVKINLAGENHDPFELMKSFQNLSPAAINKIRQLNSSDKNVVGGAYFLLGESLLKGQGVAQKDETTGRFLLAKSASLAYADAMANLGELWCVKTKQYKKDYHMSSAWFRLGVFFGKEDIGNSWIYKSKYLEQKKK
ncbi:hypothetical protein METBIDRAFT_40976 [Metschnikowia bicuspidata var. bicuspidata NRRL YB-4993]|uniref:HCP-like protein n=1 Tax=Metschnikowia bicuspidata var. bicuspidata NRRL YB-4993 TaxID=869754 RepID=A0A1A0HCH2_9ASCO|nr:hypothetical protein METBIDRAFT_40976 [Metschnikowia bicuspidata var. bicuspidata NRRL YB-4993]OBA21608.1 hypothetical protein METBIDRAFT_40976 [Metschnikowia bicuspidata var. bicuspidata NRRL YB-4993]